MCDARQTWRPGWARWQGWSDVPAPEPGRPIGDWIDLSHTMTEDLSRARTFPRPVFRRLETLPNDPVNLTEIQMVAHHGTHVDAPRHFIADGPTFEEIPLNRLYGPAVVWALEKEEFAPIRAADFERARPHVNPGDMVLLHTGWAGYINTPRYENHPHLDAEAATWLAARGVKLLGVDFGTPDVCSHRRPPGFTWPVHQILLSRGILIAEHVANLASLAGRRVEAFFLGPPIAGSDGAPVRAIARAIA